MRRSALVAALCSIALLPGAALAADLRTPAVGGGGNLTIPRGAPIEDDLYVFGGTVTVSADVPGDLHVLGGNVTVDGTVAGDLVVAGGDVKVPGTVRGSVRAVTGDADVSGTVGGDLLFLGGTLTLGPSGAVAGDIVAAGGTLTLDGSVAGSVLARAGEAGLRGPIGEWADVHADRATLAASASVGGDLTLRTAVPATIDATVPVAGSRNLTVTPKRGADPVQGVLAGFWKSVTLAIAALLLIAVFRKKGETIVHEFQGRVWRNAAWGLAGLLLPIPAAGLLAMTVVGIPFAIGLLFVYLIALYVAAAWSAVFLGTWALRLVLKKAPVDWRAALLGVLILWIVAMVPRLGILLESALLVYALGVTLRVDARAVALLREADLHP